MKTLQISSEGNNLASVRENKESANSEIILDMIDLFYANKHLYKKIA